MVCDELEAMLLRASLFFLLAVSPVEGGTTIWKLRVLLEFWLTAVVSLGAGLLGDCISGCGRLLYVLESVLVLEICARAVPSRVFSSDPGRTLCLTRPRLEIGSKEMTRGLGIET